MSAASGSSRDSSGAPRSACRCGSIAANPAGAASVRRTIRRWHHERPHGTAQRTRTPAGLRASSNSGAFPAPISSSASLVPNSPFARAFATSSPAYGPWRANAIAWAFAARSRGPLSPDPLRPNHRPRVHFRCWVDPAYNRSVGTTGATPRTRHGAHVRHDGAGKSCTSPGEDVRGLDLSMHNRVCLPKRGGRSRPPEDRGGAGGGSVQGKAEPEIVASFGVPTIVSQGGLHG